MARGSKAKRKTQTLDIEAIGLVLLALGIFVAGMLVPVLPSGELGLTARALLLGPIGWGAYLLPLPPLVLGGFFLLRRVPQGWGRVLLGYLVLGAGLWLILVLVAPAASGQGGLTIRAALTGMAGALAYLLGLFIASLGLELMLGWRPTRLARGFLRWVVQGVRVGYKSFLQLRHQAKARAVFAADVALARNALKSLDYDLQALSALYPGSAELERWRSAIGNTLHKLARADQALLADAQADIAAWQEAVSGFTRDRAGELIGHLRAEGLTDMDGWLRAMKAQLAEPISGLVRPARPLDDLRQLLALELTALVERYSRLTRERDLAEAALRTVKPRALSKLFEQHQQRQQEYQQILAARQQLEQESDLLSSWRELVARLLILSRELPTSPELLELSEALTTELREKGRPVLAQLAGWQAALAAVAARARGGGDIAPAAHPVTMSAELALEPLAEEDALPEVGGIPLQLPGYDLLDQRDKGDEDPLVQAREVQARIAKIDETLANFGLQGRVVASVRGPAVTRFEVEPAPGEKISRFAGLSDDLALAMAVGSVRIEAPIPGKSVIGLEVPNASRELISFREAVESVSFRRAKARLPLILGKSIDSEMIIGDLAKMPHLLIAGSTGSGKSVAVNTLVGSLLYKFLPTELRFLMIDPKMVELTPFDGIPHLLRPVVTNPADAAGVLLGAVAHMERRYQMMSKLGTKNLDQYNQKARNLDLPELPFIVVIIDELADLMITSPKEVESAIMRLAQMARATGMHLILATQRPSVDILTSLIKVNVPARIAFAVSSSHDSRTILDGMGAERLTGLGDMLFYQPGLVKALRLQGPFVSESEIYQLANFLRRQYFDDEFGEAYGADFDSPPLHDSAASGLVDWNDDKLREAAELVIQEGQASVSRLQRRLSVGHARAGKLMDSLEALGVVGPHTGSKPREVLVAFEELPNIFGK